MKTASFFTYRGPGRISIARWAPRRHPKGYRIFRELAPGEWFNSVPRDEYLRRFEAEVLDVLSPFHTWAKLEELAGGVEPVLLCWEKPPFTEGNWCHRRIVAEWFKEHMGKDVPEMSPEQLQLATATRVDEITADPGVRIDEAMGRLDGMGDPMGGKK